MEKTGKESKGLIYYFKAASIILGVFLTVTGIYAAAFKFVYGSNKQIVDFESFSSCYEEIQNAMIDSISSSNNEIRKLRTDLEKNNKARIDEIKLINQKMNAIIQAVPNNKELIKKVDEIHYFYQQWNEDEKNNRKGIYSGESSIGTK